MFTWKTDPAGWKMSGHRVHRLYQGSGGTPFCVAESVRPRRRPKILEVRVGGFFCRGEAWDVDTAKAKVLELV
jgi:hypothetical protein